ncbi:MAG: hypothetical protein AAB729_05735 [Patescibacteria group bacterium]
MPHGDKLRRVLDGVPEIFDKAERGQENEKNIEVDPTQTYKLSSGDDLYVNGIFDESLGNINVRASGNIAIFTKDKDIAAKAHKFPNTNCSRFFLMRLANPSEKTPYQLEHNQQVMLFHQLELEGDQFKTTEQSTTFIPR